MPSSRQRLWKSADRVSPFRSQQVSTRLCNNSADTGNSGLHEGFQYEDTTRLAPEAYVLDTALLARPGNDEIQLDLFLDYASNVAPYPKFQDYFRSRRPPLIAVWGKNDPFFLPPGAEAFKRDNPSAEVHFFDTGHFALETHADEISSMIRDFLGRKLKGILAA
jgi:pimeloyl-ACP methyl ester carboxylesterase